MKPFPNDIVLVDFEVTGFDIDQDEPVQVGVLVLDSATLGEKDSFSSWIKPQQKLSSDMKGFKWAGIGEEEIQNIKNAPPLNEVARKIDHIIPEDYTLSAWNATFDYYFWKQLVEQVNRKKYAARILDIWTLAQAVLLWDENYQENYTSESVFQYFGEEERGTHDALDDCNREARVLGKLLERGV